MTQKVIRIGSSAGVTIPKKEMERLGLRVGDRVDIDVKPTSRLSVDDKEVVVWTKKFIERYRPTLEALADK